MNTLLICTKIYYKGKNYETPTLGSKSTLTEIYYSKTIPFEQKVLTVAIFRNTHMYPITDYLSWGTNLTGPFVQKLSITA